MTAVLIYGIISSHSINRKVICMEALDVVVGIFTDIIDVVFAFSPATREVLINLFSFFATSMGGVIEVLQGIFSTI